MGTDQGRGHGAEAVKKLGGTTLWEAKERFRASTKSMLCHRKSASRLSMGTSISCNMAIPGSFARNCSYYGRKLIAEAAFSRTSQFGIVAQGPAQAQAPALCASLGLHLPVSATGGGRFRPSATYTPPPADKKSKGPKRPENLPLGWFSAEAGPEGPGQQRTVSPRKLRSLNARRAALPRAAAAESDGWRAGCRPW